MVKGTVKRWMDLRGYGFIDTKAKDEDVFVHVSDLKDRESLREGEKVEFDIESTYKGPRAVNVTPIAQ
jgi:CspA family cold shock protein